MIKWFITLSILCISLLHSQDRRGYIVSVGDTISEIYIDTENIIEKYKGKVIMLQFTASWCGVCLKEMPFIENEIWQKHQKDDFILIALARDTETRPQRKKEIEFLKEKTGVTYPIISDKNSSIFELFATKKAGVTRNIIIDQNGVIQFLTRLFDRDEFDEMKLKIDELLKKKT